MKIQGNITVLLALDNMEMDTASTSPRTKFLIVAVFAIWLEVISQLHVKEIGTWMITK